MKRVVEAQRVQLCAGCREGLAPAQQRGRVVGADLLARISVKLPPPPAACSTAARDGQQQPGKMYSLMKSVLRRYASYRPPAW
jgi:hypothetical protein